MLPYIIYIPQKYLWRKKFWLFRILHILFTFEIFGYFLFVSYFLKSNLQKIRIYTSLTNRTANFKLVSCKKVLHEIQMHLPPVVKLQIFRTMILMTKSRTVKKAIVFLDDVQLFWKLLLLSIGYSWNKKFDKFGNISSLRTFWRHRHLKYFIYSQFSPWIFWSILFEN